MKKIGIILMSMFLTAVVFQSCIDDQSALTDPRDAIAKRWQVTEDNSSLQPYWVTITKDPDELTKVWFENFHALGDSENVYGILAGSIISIPQQTTTSGYTIDGEGTIVSDNINWEYTVDEGDGPVDYTSTFGTVVTTKKKLTASL